jgi:hypothetical protein
MARPILFLERDLFCGEFGEYADVINKEEIPDEYVYHMG